MFEGTKLALTAKKLVQVVGEISSIPLSRIEVYARLPFFSLCKFTTELVSSRYNSLRVCGSSTTGMGLCLFQETGLWRGVHAHMGTPYANWAKEKDEQIIHALTIAHYFHFVGSGWIIVDSFVLGVGVSR